MSIWNDEGNSDKTHDSLDEEKNEASEGKHDREENYLSSDVNVNILSQSFSEAGSYYLGPIVRRFIRNPVAQFLARKKGTDEYYLMKILILKDGNTKDKLNIHRRVVFHTEYTILSLLKGHPGVIQLHDFFKDSVFETFPGEGEKEIRRICMVMECLIPHGCHNQELISLPEYLTEKRRLSEPEALHIFMNILLVIDDLHNKKIVHKDLKLSSIILNRKNLQIKLINFYFAKLLSSENEVFHNQRGNPAYMAPDFIGGKPVSPKPCDMWSAGVILYTMLHGYLPFIGNPNWGTALSNTRVLADLYSKIVTSECIISDEMGFSEGTKELIRGLLRKDPLTRLKSGEAVDMLRTILTVQSSSQNKIFPSSQYSDQIVPECPIFEEKPISDPSCTECWLIVNKNVPTVSSKTYKIAISEVAAKMGKNKEKRCKWTKNADQSSNMGKGLMNKKCNHTSRRASMSRNNKIKYAMLRLGATSVNNISALSFNYSDRNTSRSQL